MDFKNICNINSLQLEDWKAGERYQGQSADIAGEMGAKKMGFHVEILPPGMFSCPYHFHRLEEEWFFVIAGKAMLRQHNRYRELTPGDILHFGCSEEYAHQFYNHTDAEFKFIALSTIDENDIAEYPDSNKIYFRKQKKMFLQASVIPYLTGEENPEDGWDRSMLTSVPGLCSRDEREGRE